MALGGGGGFVFELLFTRVNGRFVFSRMYVLLGEVF